MGKTQQPHDAAIRARLLNTLGIYKKLAPVRTSNESLRRKYVLRGNIPPHHPYCIHHPSTTTTCGGTHPHTVIGGKPVIPRQEPLKDQTPSSSSSPSSVPSRILWNPSSFSPTFSSNSPSTSTLATSPPFTSTTGGDGGGRGIHFDSNVSVVVIPSRYQYSNRIKRCIWSNSSEIRENAERNTMEFRAEGWDWHSVLEDDDMYLNATTGELVHPVWVNSNEEGFSLIEDEEEEEEDSESFGVSLEWDGPSAPTLTRSLSRVADGLNQMMIVESLNQMMIDNNNT